MTKHTPMDKDAAARIQSAAARHPDSDTAKDEWDRRAQSVSYTANWPWFGAIWPVQREDRITDFALRVALSCGRAIRETLQNRGSVGSTAK